jgi:hypothetical protein
VASAYDEIETGAADAATVVPARKIRHCCTSTRKDSATNAWLRRLVVGRRLLLLELIIIIVIVLIAHGHGSLLALA